MRKVGMGPLPVSFAYQKTIARQLKLSRLRAGRLLITVARLGNAGGYDSRVTPQMVGHAAYCFVCYSDGDGVDEFLAGENIPGSELARIFCGEVIMTAVEAGQCRKYPWGITAADFSTALKRVMSKWQDGGPGAMYQEVRDLKDKSRTIWLSHHEKNKKKAA